MLPEVNTGYTGLVKMNQRVVHENREQGLGEIKNKVEIATKLKYCMRTVSKPVKVDTS